MMRVRRAGACSGRPGPGGSCRRPDRGPCRQGDGGYGPWLAMYTLRGYSSRMDDRLKKSQLARLGRIEGQVRGVARMIEEDRYCIDVLTQIQAVRAALGKVESEMLKAHLDHCIESAIVSGDKDEQRRKATELIDRMERAR